MCIPVIGLIFIIVWTCGGCRKVNKKSFARATLITIAIGLVISVIGYFALCGVINSVLKEVGLGELVYNSSSEKNNQGDSSDTSDQEAQGV